MTPSPVPGLSPEVEAALLAHAHHAGPAGSHEPTAGSPPGPARSFEGEPHHADGSPAGAVAQAPDHDPGHLVAVAPTSSPTAPPGPFVLLATTHDDHTLMGPGVTSRLVVTMPMHHPTPPMSRGVAARDAEPGRMHEALDAAPLEAAASPPEPHGHRADPDLDLDLGPDSEPDLDPSLATAMRGDPEVDVEAIAHRGADLAGPPVAPPHTADPRGETPGPAGSSESAGLSLVISTGLAAVSRMHTAPGPLPPDVEEPSAGLFRGLATRLRALGRRLRASARVTSRRARD